MKPGNAFPKLALPHSDPQLRTSQTVLDRWVCGWTPRRGGGTRGLGCATPLPPSTQAERSFELVLGQVDTQ